MEPLARTDRDAGSGQRRAEDPVSYTHLDVYKRQAFGSGAFSSDAFPSGAFGTGAFGFGACTSGAFTSGALGTGAFISDAFTSGAFESGACASGAVAGLAVGPITGIAKKGWEYLWVRYADAEDPLTGTGGSTETWTFLPFALENL